MVVINFLNERNDADRRVLELLTQNFNIFSGVVSVWADVLGSINAAINFEKHILGIYQECRTPEEFDIAFRTLQAEMDEQIRTRLDDMRRVLFEHFDEDVTQRLRLQLAVAQAQLDRKGRRFWSLTCFMLDGRARLDYDMFASDIEHPPRDEFPKGRYHLVSQSHPRVGTNTNEGGGEPANAFLYRLSHPLGEHVVDAAKALPTPLANIAFDVTNDSPRLHVIKILRGKASYLTLARFTISSCEWVKYLLFSGIDEADVPLDQEAMEKLFCCRGRTTRDGDGQGPIPISVTRRLNDESDRHAHTTVSRSPERNNRHVNEAREKLECRTADMVLSAEEVLLDTKMQIEARRRQARQAVTLAEQHEIQEKIRDFERRQSQRTEAETLLTIRWAVE